MNDKEFHVPQNLSPSEVIRIHGSLPLSWQERLANSVDDLEYVKDECGGAIAQLSDIGLPDGDEYTPILMELRKMRGKMNKNNRLHEDVTNLIDMVVEIQDEAVRNCEHNNEMLDKAITALERISD